MDNSNAYNNEDIVIRFFSELNIDDPFFDTLKESYPGFKDWFMRKAADNESAYVFMDRKERILDFLYLKNEDEEMNDVNPPLPAKRRLKIGTFKISQRGSKRSERFMKKIMDRAIADDVDEIYVTIFPKANLEYLIKIFEYYGFEHIANKDHGERGYEYVLVKNMRKFNGDIFKDYPFVKSEGVEKRILSIKPNYHTLLFPDSILHNENPYNLVKDISHTNSIHKIYICWMYDVNQLKKGDILLIYRTSDGLGSANYRSVVTSVCTVNEIKTYNDFYSEDDFIRYTNQYSIFPENDLRKWYRYKNNFTVIKMLYNVAFTQKVIRKSLLEEVGMNADMYWGFCPVTDEQYKRILKLGGADERYFVD